MAADLAQVIIRATDDSKGAFDSFKSNVRNSQDQLRSFENYLTATYGRLQSLLGVLGVGLSFQEITQATVEMERALSRLDAALQATNYAAGRTRDQLENMAEALSKATAFDDDDIRKGITALLRFRDVQGDVFDQAIKLSADLAAAMGEDIVSAAQHMGRALSDPETGLRGLRAAGLNLQNSQLEMVKTLMKTGETAQAQKIVLDELTKSIGGTAAAENQGLYGSSRAAAKAWDDMLKAIGKTSAYQAVTKDFFGFVKQSLDDIRNIVQNGDWVEKLLAITAFAGGMRGLSLTPNAAGDSTSAVSGKIRGAPMSPLDFGGMTEVDWRVLQLQKLLDIYKNRKPTATQDNGYQQLVDGLRQKLALEQGSTEVERVLFDLTKARYADLSELQKKNLVDIAAEVDAKQQVARANKSLVDSAELQIDAQQRMDDVLAGFNETQSEALQQIQFETELYGMNDTQRETAIALRKLEQDWIKASIGLSGEEFETLKKIYDLQREMLPGVISAREAAKQADELRKQQTDAQKKLDEDLQRGLTDSIFRGFEAGKGFAENFRDSLVNMFKTTILTPVIKWIVSPLTGAATAALGSLGIPGLANAAGGGGGGLSDMLSMGSNASSLFGGGGGLLGSAGAYSLATGAGAEQAAMLAAQTGVFGAAGTAATAGAGAAGVGAAAAIPYIGWGIAAYSALNAMGVFGGGGGGPANFTGIDVNANLSKNGFAGQLFGTSKNSDTSFSWPTFMPGNLQQTADAAVSAAFAKAGQLAQIMGIDPSALNGVSANVSFRSASHDAATITQDLVNNLGALTDQMAQALIPNIKDLAQANETLTQTFTRLAQAQLAAKTDSIFNVMNAALKLADSTRDLWLSDLSPLTAQQRLTQASSSYGTTLTAARGGDANAMAELANVSRTYLSEARSYYASSQDYTAIFAKVQTDVQGLVVNTLVQQSAQFAKLGVPLDQIAANTANMDPRLVGMLNLASDLNSMVDRYLSGALGATQGGPDLTGIMESALTEQALQYVDLGSAIDLQTGQFAGMSSALGSIDAHIADLPARFEAALDRAAGAWLSSHATITQGSTNQIVQAVQQSAADTGQVLASAGSTAFIDERPRTSSVSQFRRDNMG